MALLNRSRRALAVGALATWSSVGAGQEAPTAQEVEAAFLCSFGQFVEWPAGVNDGPVTIGILGKDPFGAMLDATVLARAGQTPPVEVRRVDDLEASGGLRIAFISTSETQSLSRLLPALEGRNVLTVSDIRGFAAKGGMIGFFLEENRVRFEINLAAAERAGLRISSRLLKLARLVGD